MILDYSAACGVLGGLKRRSLKESDIEQFKEKEAGFLKESLKKYLRDDYPPQDRADYLERALYSSHIKKIVKLLRFLDASVSGVLKALLLEFDILNLKLLMRQIKLGKVISSDMFYWGYPYLAFKSKDPTSFKEIEDLKKYLKRDPLIRSFFIRALKDLDFYKDIYHFDICLDREYLKLLQKESLKIDRKSSSLIQYFIAIKSLMYALRLKFFQRRDFDEILSTVCVSPFFDKEFLSKMLNAVSLEEALSFIEASRIFLKFKAELSSDFEEDLENIFYSQFLQKQGGDIFTLHPYLVFYLRQNYLVEKMIFIINNTFK